MIKFNSNQPRSSQSGVALLEFAIMAPLFLMLCLLTYDLGRALTHHLVATQVAREGVRRAIGSRGLERGRYILTESNGLPVCSFRLTPTSSNSTCPSSSIQLQLLTRIYRTQRSLEGQQSMAVVPNSRTIVVEFGYLPAADPANITVRVGFSYRGVSIMFANAPVSASLTSSYL